jgi:hypothetical protein
MAPPKGKSNMPAATATTLKKAAAGSKTTGETEADYPAAPVRMGLKIYGLLTYDKYTI